MAINGISASSVTIPSDQGFSPNIDQYNKNVKQVIDALAAFEQAVHDHDDKKQSEIADQMCRYTRTADANYFTLLNSGNVNERTFALSADVANIFNNGTGLLVRVDREQPSFPPACLGWAANNYDPHMMLQILKDGSPCTVSSMIDQFQAALAK